MQEDQIVQLDPKDVLADDNSRFSLKPIRIDGLAANILETGGVLSPVEVEAIEPAPKKGPKFRLTAGFYRHAAVEMLNTRDKAELTLPAIIRAPVDGLERLRHQVTENVEREDMSPMDTAVAIKRLIDAGVSKPDVRKTFSRPGINKGAKKNGTALQPMSNAMLNIYLNFLNLPKGIQEKIHTGAVGVAAAYELGKVPADKRQAVLDRAEADRAAELAREERDEEKFLSTQKKAEEAKTKVEEILAVVEETKTSIVEHQKMVADKTAALRAVQAEEYDPADSAGKSAYMEKLKAAEADLKAAQKLSKDVQNKLAKALEQRNKAQELAKEKAAEAEGAKSPTRDGKAGKGKGGAVSPKEIQKAAVKEGASTGYTPLTLSEIRDAVKELASGKAGADDRTVLIAKEFKACFDGIHTPKMLAETINALLDTMGASVPKKVAAKKTA